MKTEWENVNEILLVRVGQESPLKEWYLYYLFYHLSFECVFLETSSKRNGDDHVASACCFLL